MSLIALNGEKSTMQCENLGWIGKVRGNQLNTVCAAWNGPSMRIYAAEVKKVLGRKYRNLFTLDIPVRV